MSSNFQFSMVSSFSRICPRIANRMLCGQTRKFTNSTILCRRLTVKSFEDTSSDESNFESEKDSFSKENFGLNKSHNILRKSIDLLKKRQEKNIDTISEVEEGIERSEIMRQRYADSWAFREQVVLAEIDAEIAAKSTDKPLVETISMKKEGLLSPAPNLEGEEIIIPIEDRSLQKSVSLDNLGDPLPDIKEPIVGPLSKTGFRPKLLKKGKPLPPSWSTEGGVVVLVDKPKGWTSFGVCGRIRYLTKVKKVGHAGTLDPMATGLLIVCVGKATKLADSYQAMTKEYSGTFKLGEATPSYDAETEVCEELPWRHISDEDLISGAESFLGDISQVPPMFSAIKVKGVRMYEKARKGETVDLPPRPIKIHSFSVERSQSDPQLIQFHTRCSKGTYVRSLVYDLARKLGSCSHLTALRRESIGEYSVNDAWTVEQFTEAVETEQRSSVVESIFQKGASKPDFDEGK